MSLNKQQTEEALWNARGEEERARRPCAPCHGVPAPDYSIQDRARVRMAWRPPPQGTSLPWHSPFQPRVPQAGPSGTVTGPQERNLRVAGLPRLLRWASISLCLGWPVAGHTATMGMLLQASGSSLTGGRQLYTWKTRWKSWEPGFEHRSAPSCVTFPVQTSAPLFVK